MELRWGQAAHTSCLRKGGRGRGKQTHPLSRGSWKTPEQLISPETNNTLGCSQQGSLEDNLHHSNLTSSSRATSLQARQKQGGEDHSLLRVSKFQKLWCW